MKKHRVHDYNIYDKVDDTIRRERKKKVKKKEKSSHLPSHHSCTTNPSNGYQGNLRTRLSIISRRESTSSMNLSIEFSSVTHRENFVRDLIESLYEYVVSTSHLRVVRSNGKIVSKPFVRVS